MMMIDARIALLVLLPAVTAAQAQQIPPSEGGDPTVIGQVEHLGWLLVGSRGRHYVFGGIAMADYADSDGRRRIVAMQREEQIQDEKFVYYRELRDGHRWALARQAGADGALGVWFQYAATEANPKPGWLSFHRGRLETPRDEAMAAAISCGQ